MELTAVQEDYLEVILRLEKVKGEGGVRIIDIASELGTRMPTVTRTVRRLTEIGLLSHPHRQEVALSDRGRKLAGEVVHRHDDLVWFMTEVLGTPKEQAEADACQIEHGMSADTAQRLHEFLEYIAALPDPDQEVLKRFRTGDSRTRTAFRALAPSRGRGWRR